MLLSICIPTYNRPSSLTNCLNSIYVQKKINKKDLEICISDNCSKFNIRKVIKPFKKKLNIRYQKNKKIWFCNECFKRFFDGKGKVYLGFWVMMTL